MARTAASTAPPDVSLLTYNVRNYLPTDRRTIDGFRPDYPKPEAEKDALRRLIHAAAPDVVALQEMGSAGHLEELRRDLAAEGTTFSFAHLLEAQDPDRRIALLALHPPVALTPHPLVPTSAAALPVRRGVLEATFEHGGLRWTLFVVHLKSRFTDNPADPGSANQRAAEARAVRDLVLARTGTTAAGPHRAAFLVVGDLNDGLGSRTLVSLTTRSHRPVLHRIPAADDRGETWTLHHAPSGDYNTFDHILASPGFLAAASPVASVVPELSDPPGSDHRPLLLRWHWIPAPPG